MISDSTTEEVQVNESTAKQEVVQNQQENNDKIHVFVSGITGFVASEIVKQLLERKNYIIHGTVRNVSNSKEKVINSLIEYSNGTLTREIIENNLQFFEADLLKEGSFKEAIQGCQYVMHVASPYKIVVENPQRDLVDPALNGTLNVLRECVEMRKLQDDNDDKRLKRVILTSSVAAVVHIAEPGKVYSEEDWNTGSSLNDNPYFYSKTLAEKAAWKLLQDTEKEKGKGFLELVTINPSGVIGACMFPDLINQSHEVITRIVKGEFPMVIDLGFPFVDIKDVALAHILAMESKDDFSPSKQERFIIASDTVPMKDFSKFIIDTFPKDQHSWVKGVPTFDMTGKFGSGIAYLVGYTQPKLVRTFLHSSLGRPLVYSNQKAKTRLGINFIDWRQSVKETIEWLLKSGTIFKK
ncbi:hypothetical protein ABK040_001292 [Willaertia magna]